MFKNPVNFTVTKIEFYKELYEHEDHIDPIYKKLVPTGTPIVMMCQYRSNATFSVSTQPISISMSLSMILSMTPWEHVGDILGISWGFLGVILGISWFPIVGAYLRIFSDHSSIELYIKRRKLAQIFTTYEGWTGMLKALFKLSKLTLHLFGFLKS